MEDDLNFFILMEDDLNYFQAEDNLNILENRRQTQHFSNVR